MSNSTFEAPSPEYLDTLLSQYDVESFIAQGGMGAVYRGRQRSLDREVAIKILPREVGEDPEFRESFSTEAKAMAKLNHPNLIGVYDFGTVEDMPYIVMEYIHGKSLHDSAYNQVVDPVQAAAIVSGICDGLAHAHDHGIVHRDIKPANILLTPKAEPKIGDSGLAHATESDGPGLVMGTPGYTAPEVFVDPGQAGMLADLYSVGVILHQLLSGIDPAGSEGPPTQATGQLRLDMIWRKATQLDPSQRYPSAAAMAADLAKVASAQTAARQVVSPAPSLAPVRPLASARKGSGGALKIALAGAVGVALVIAIVVISSQGSRDGDGLAGGVEPVAPAPPETTPEIEAPAESNPVSTDPVEVVEQEPEDVVTSEEPTPVVAVEPEPELPPDVEKVLEPGDPELRARAVSLIEEARARRDEAFSANARELFRELAGRANRADPDEIRLINHLMDDIVDDRVPYVDDVDGIEKGLAEEFDRALAKDEGIEDAYHSDLGRIGRAYKTRLEAAAADATDEDLKMRLLAQAEEAGDLEDWVQALAPESGFKRKRSGGHFAGFAGHWDVQGANLVQWIADANGGVEINSGQWKGKTATWKITEDGSLEIHWPDKPRPYVLTRDGNGWTGKTSFGQAVSITPGNW